MINLLVYIDLGDRTASVAPPSLAATYREGSRPLPLRWPGSFHGRISSVASMEEVISTEETGEEPRR